MEPISTAAAIASLIHSSMGITKRVLDAVDARASETGQTRQEVFRDVAAAAQSQSAASVVSLAQAASQLSNRSLDAYARLGGKGKVLAMLGAAAFAPAALPAIGIAVWRDHRRPAASAE